MPEKFFVEFYQTITIEFIIKSLISSSSNMNDPSVSLRMITFNMYCIILDRSPECILLSTSQLFLTCSLNASIVRDCVDVTTSYARSTSSRRFTVVVSDCNVVCKCEFWFINRSIWLDNALCVCCNAITSVSSLCCQYAYGPMRLFLFARPPTHPPNHQSKRKQISSDKKMVNEKVETRTLFVMVCCCYA